VVDIGLWGALIPDSIAHIAEMHELGAVAFKGFMSAAGAQYPMVEDGDLLAGLEAARPLGALIGVHAEGEALTKYFTNQLEQAGRRDPRAIAEGRPPIAEYEAIQRAIVLARYARARLHIVHMSIPEGADLIQAAKSEAFKSRQKRVRTTCTWTGPRSTVWVRTPSASRPCGHRKAPSDCGRRSWPAKSTSSRPTTRRIAGPTKTRRRSGKPGGACPAFRP